MSAVVWIDEWPRQLVLNLAVVFYAAVGAGALALTNSSVEVTSSAAAPVETSAGSNPTAINLEGFGGLI